MVRGVARGIGVVLSYRSFPQKGKRDRLDYCRVGINSKEQLNSIFK